MRASTLSTSRASVTTEVTSSAISPRSRRALGRCAGALVDGGQLEGRRAVFPAVRQRVIIPRELVYYRVENDWKRYVGRGVLVYHVVFYTMVHQTPPSDVSISRIRARNNLSLAFKSKRKNWNFTFDSTNRCTIYTQGQSKQWYTDAHHQL